MPPFVLVDLVVGLLLQAPPANLACQALTPAQVASLIGTARMIPVTASQTGSSCMFQNNDKVITVLVATVSTADAAQGLFNSKKRIVSGADIQALPVPAYAGFIRPAAIVGVLKQQTLTEVKVIDPAQSPEAMGTKLQAIMKDLAAKP